MNQPPSAARPERSTPVVADDAASSSTSAEGSRDRVADDRQVLTRLVTARNAWLDVVTAILVARPWAVGVWLVGSLGRGNGDAYSDVDLVVAVDHSAPRVAVTDPVAGLSLPGRIVYRRSKPCNAPAGGAYLALGVELCELPVLVDIFVWPANTAAVPDGALVLHERANLPRTGMTFVQLLDLHRSSAATGSDPHDPGTVLMLVQLAAKYFVRGNEPKLAGICDQLGAAASDGCDLATLRSILEQRIDPVTHAHTRDGVRAVQRLLELVERQRQHTRRHRAAIHPDRVR